MTTGRFLLDFNIWFWPDGKEFNVGIYIHAWLSCFVSPKWSRLPPLLSFLFKHLMLLYWRDSSRAWGHHVMPQPEALLGSPVPEGTGPAGLLGVTFEATWPSSTHCVEEGLERLPLLTLYWGAPLLLLPQPSPEIAPQGSVSLPPPPYLSTIKAPTQDATKEPDVSSRCFSGKQDKGKWLFLLLVKPVIQ